MRKDNALNIKISFEGVPLIDKEFYGLEEANKAWKEIRRKLK